MKVRGFSSFVSNARFGVTGMEGLSNISTNSDNTGSDPSRAGASPQPQNNESMASFRDEMFMRLRREAAEVVKREPILSVLLSKAGLIDANTTSSNSNKKIIRILLLKKQQSLPRTSHIV
mmetsp:Transcript_11803/g.25508  ORF Transcript_11803/g.25508 Transcript_11803/m.25508 type:complete len:120 (+) Transcript_11803:21-380(+)